MNVKVDFTLCDSPDGAAVHGRAHEPILRRRGAQKGAVLYARATVDTLQTAHTQTGGDPAMM